MFYGNTTNGITSLLNIRGELGKISDGLTSLLNVIGELGNMTYRLTSLLRVLSAELGKVTDGDQKSVICIKRVEDDARLAQKTVTYTGVLPRDCGIHNPEGVKLLKSRSHYNLLHLPSDCKKFTVNRASTLVDTVNGIGKYDLKGIVPEHFMLSWEMSINFAVPKITREDTKQIVKTKRIWRKIGKIGVGNNRQSISMEVKMEDNSICTDPKNVLDKWKCAFSSMLNSGNLYEATGNHDSSCIITDNFLDGEITKEEVLNILKLSKAGKSPGDEIPMEMYKNTTAINALSMCSIFVIIPE
ncbi:unnamed protein product [Mytilus coruscus]|uniref:Uncharacterized protein n=1 Tax=Mytilus coruscus TaxID=42192 RepID=A0A6J8EDQ1_MYTCO|nr:unnamed protein product [Mytilus coruscus]